MRARTASLVCLASLVVACSPPAASSPRKNVVLITLDTVRADYLSCYGYPRETTVNLDRLARDGVRFEFCMSTAGLTPVSHASILTGLNQYSHGLRVMDAGSGYSLPENVPTLTTILSGAGWKTGAFLSAFPVTERFGFDRGFDHFDNGLGGEEVPIQQLPDGNTRWAGEKYQRSSDRTTDAAIEWLGTHEDPFFLWVHYWDPHDPHLLPPLEVLERFGLGDELDPALEVLEGRERVLELTRRHYAAELYYVDRQIGRLIEHLKRRGRSDDTILVVTSDHGEGLGEHDWLDHKILYQEQVHVPLIVRWPEGPRGQVVPELVRTTDIVPTVLEELGIPAPELHGRGLRGLALGEEEPGRVAYADALNKWDLNARIQKSRPQDLMLHVVMDREWKLIYRPLEPEKSELFHLVEDRDEAVNLYAEDHPEVLRLKADLDGRGAYEMKGFGKRVDDPEIDEAFEKTGYLDPAEEDDGDDRR